jgi:nitrogen regulatory protein P-II 2
MKRVEVTLAPDKLDAVKDALAEVGFLGMTVQETRVFGPASRRREVYRGSSYVVDFALKVKVEIVVGDDAVHRVLEIFERWAWSGERDASHALVSDVVEAVRIRTGERGNEAIDDPRALEPLAWVAEH